MADETGDRLDELLHEQIAYYRARAGEYDEWFLRTGRYDRGEEQNRHWFAEVAEVAAALDAFRPAGRVLELAAGTGLWTERLARYADHITALDASAETLAINRARMHRPDATPGPTVDYEQADIFTWQPRERYDVVFFSFWLSHVPRERFAAFWQTVRSALADGGRVFCIDSLYSDLSTARDHQLAGPEAASLRRRLNDGREYSIVKVFYRPDELSERLAALGWRADARVTPSFFLYGEVVPAT
jgi:2-polyprenyl-3-methyl-5-hydroxy-6-metoxy-1,4-benzoquinol methylase